MTIPEDIVKACKQAGFPSAMVETLIRIHNQQVELEKAIKDINPGVTSEQLKELARKQAAANSIETGFEHIA
jgi:hypothetical protein